jgi:hypothetical protein
MFILFTNVTFNNIEKIQSYKIQKCANPFKVNVFNTDNIYQFQDLVIQNGTGTAPDSQGFVGVQGWVREWAPGNFFGSCSNLVQPIAPITLGILLSL